MRIAHKKYFFLSLLLSAVVIAFDQLSKWWLLRTVAAPIEVTGFFNIVLVWNHGISFGMFSGHRAPLLLMLMAFIILLILLRWLAQVAQPLTACSIGLVIGGALANVIDRARFGAVVDFLDFHAGALHWPAFNLADSAIFMGVVVLCGESMMRPRSPQ